MVARRQDGIIRIDSVTVDIGLDDPLQLPAFEMSLFSPLSHIFETVTMLVLHCFQHRYRGEVVIMYPHSSSFNDWLRVTIPSLKRRKGIQDHHSFRQIPANSLIYLLITSVVSLPGPDCPVDVLRLYHRPIMSSLLPYFGLHPNTLSSLDCEQQPRSKTIFSYINFMYKGSE